MVLFFEGFMNKIQLLKAALQPYELFRILTINKLTKKGFTAAKTVFFS